MPIILPRHESQLNSDRVEDDKYKDFENLVKKYKNYLKVEIWKYDRHVVDFRDMKCRMVLWSSMSD